MPTEIPNQLRLDAAFDEIPAGGILRKTILVTASDNCLEREILECLEYGETQSGIGTTSIFIQGDVHVAHDMLGARRAAGIAAGSHFVHALHFLRPLEHSIDCRRDDPSPRKHLPDAREITTTYTNDAKGRVLTSTTGGVTSEWVYDAAGLLTSFTDGNGVVYEQAYDSRGNPTISTAGSNASHPIVTETVFAWPGIGRLTYEAVIYRDFPLLQAGIILKSILILSINLGVDILYAYVDPRIRLA